MLTKFNDEILELPFKASMKMKNQKELYFTIRKITNHLKINWGTYSVGEKPIEIDYGYDFVCKAITESDNDLYINNSISEYLEKRKDSIIAIESIVACLIQRKSSVNIEKRNILKIHNILLNIYNSKVEPFENRYMEREGIELFIEYIFVMLLIYLKTDCYFSIEELVYRYNNLFFPYFFDGSGAIKNNCDTISKNELSKKVSQFKKDGTFGTSDIIELRHKGILSNYVNEKSLYTIEQSYNKLNRLINNSTYSIDKLEKFTKECIELRNLINKDFTPFLDISLNNKTTEWNQLLNTFFNEKYVLIYTLWSVDCIIDDILSYDELSLTFNEYEESFWERYHSLIKIFNREKLKELYYLTLGFILLYEHRIKFGKFDYRYFVYICNTFPEYKNHVEKVRIIFKGTKGSTIFSKVFEKFISQIILPKSKTNIKDKANWKSIKKFITGNINNNALQDVIYDNIKYTDKKISNFLNSVENYYNQIIDETNKKVIQLNIGKYEIISPVTEPIKEEELELNNTIIIGNFENKGRKELGMIVNGEYSSITIEQLYSPDHTPAIKFLLNEFFNSKKYLYRMIYPNDHIDNGIIYFYDLDDTSGRYKTFDNINIENEAILHDTRYGRFSIDLYRQSLKLTENGCDNVLGEYRINLINIKFNWQDHSITSEAYHIEKGKVIVEFEAIG